MNDHLKIYFFKDIPSNSKLTDKKQKKQKKSNGGSRSCCAWIFGSILLFGGIAGLIAYDHVLHNGIFEESSFGRILKQTGKTIVKLISVTIILIIIYY